METRFHLGRCEGIRFWYLRCRDLSCLLVSWASKRIHTHSKRRMATPQGVQEGRRASGHPPLPGPILEDGSGADDVV